MKRFFLLVVSLLIAAAVWLPSLHFFFQAGLRDYVAEGAIPPKTRALAARHIALWEDAASRQRELAQMRSSCAEWDLMGRMFVVLALGNMACREPDKETEYIAVVDTIIEDTLRLEKEHGFLYFLMPYAKDIPFVAEPPRSLFLDGEIALMCAARRLVKDHPGHAATMSERIEMMIAQMEQSPVLAAESYPDECWLFCNTVAIAAIKLSDVLDGPRHADFIARWLDVTKANLLEPETGLLYSTYDLNGMPMEGPEGSSIWMAAHCLKLVDEPFARDQYQRAKKELGRSLLGFGYAREWPESYVGPPDVDSGPVIPGLGISAGSSGLALLGASAFHDAEFVRGLLTSLRFAGFPFERDGQLRFCASNQVGDAVVFYALVLGPLWDKAHALEEKRP